MAQKHILALDMSDLYALTLVAFIGVTNAHGLSPQTTG